MTLREYLQKLETTTIQIEHDEKPYIAQDLLTSIGKDEVIYTSRNLKRLGSGRMHTLLIHVRAPLKSEDLDKDVIVHEGRVYLLNSEQETTYLWDDPRS